MSLTIEELERFHDYANARINNGGVDSLEDCLRQWRAAREEEEAIADIREGLAQANAGLLRPFHEFDAEFRAKYGISVDE